jgi:ribosomal protein S12 methylthiotransferase accessory factor
LRALNGDEIVYRLGTFRSAPLAASLQIARQAAKICGVSRLAGVTGLDQIGIPVWTAIRPLGRSLSVSQGKGLTDTLAQISALMEAIELFHAETSLPSGMKRSIRQTVNDPKFVKVHELPLRSKKPLDFDLPIGWVETCSLVTGKNKWIPRELVDLDSTHAYDGFFIASSNGLASGNSRSEAIYHGLCEVLERDQVAHWIVAENLSRKRSPRRLNLATGLPASVQTIVDKIQAAGLQMAVWHASTTIEVPCFACTIADLKGNTLYPQRAAGYGCHVSKEIALLRAITEAAQSRLTFISGARDDVLVRQYEQDIRVDMPLNGGWRKTMAASNDALLYGDLPDFSGFNSFAEAIGFIISSMAKDGISDVCALDLTNDAVGVRVIHVCAPLAEYDMTAGICMPGLRICRFLKTRKRT